MSSIPFDPAQAARALLEARRTGIGVAAAEVQPPDRAGAYAVQDVLLQSLGPIGGWKVGAKTASAEPHAAPLPAAGLLPSGARLQGPQWQLRGVEVEVALRLGRDLLPASGPLDAQTLMAAVDAVLPAVEVVETRLSDLPQSDPLAQLADLQSHGALLLGAPMSLGAAGIDLREIEARLEFDGEVVASTRGGNPAADLWRLLGWLASHAAQRGQPLRAGQVITTGSCTGMKFAKSGAHVRAQVIGIGAVELHF